MTIVAWITAAFGALVVGVAAASVLDEVLGHTEVLQPERWSHDVILRTVLTAAFTLLVMALWVWFWMRYIVS